MQILGNNVVAKVSDSVGCMYYVNGAVFRTVADGVVEYIADKDGKQVRDVG
ncbi:hypothetical protein [Snodgrassella sp.]|uniref:hypothetical protein n=1 Tax=Snodgrassella sp. TaxID=2815304 RepID=UPI00258D89F9|nr:hypothetical protein [Snodgrassella sp.]MCO6517664.1 hypothetical protein [Snodgrassella sp.]